MRTSMQAKSNSVRVNQELVRPADRFFDDMVDAKKRKLDRLEMQRREREKQIHAESKFGVFRDQVQYRQAYKSRGKSTPRSMQEVSDYSQSQKVLTSIAKASSPNRQV